MDVPYPLEPEVLRRIRRISRVASEAISPSGLEAVETASRALAAADANATAFAAASLVNLAASHVIDAEAVRKATGTSEKLTRFVTPLEGLTREIGEIRALERTKHNLLIPESVARSLQEAMGGLNLSSEVNDQIAAAIEAMPRHPGAYSSWHIPAIVAAVAPLAESPEVESVLDEAALRAHLTPPEKLAKIESELIHAIGAIASLVGILIASGHTEAAGTLLIIIAALISAQRKLQD